MREGDHFTHPIKERATKGGFLLLRFFFLGPQPPVENRILSKYRLLHVTLQIVPRFAFPLETTFALDLHNMTISLGRRRDRLIGQHSTLSRRYDHRAPG
jgi:hypothetical protein